MNHIISVFQQVLVLELTKAKILCYAMIHSWIQPVGSSTRRQVGTHRVFICDSKSTKVQIKPDKRLELFTISSVYLQVFTTHVNRGRRHYFGAFCSQTWISKTLPFSLFTVKINRVWLYPCLLLPKIKTNETSILPQTFDFNRIFRFIDSLFKSCEDAGRFMDFMHKLL